MTFHRNTLLGAEPYQESQGPGTPQEPPSPVELNVFYENVQRRESAQKRLTKRKSGGGAVLWPRKAVKRSATVPFNVTGSSPSSEPPPPLANQSSFQDTTRHAEYPEMEKLEDQKEKHDGSSVVPDTDLPAWYKDIWASVPPPRYKASYRLHNPLGPRWYRNYHLIPPSHLRAGARPPSIFSPSFPPMGTTSMPERSLDSRMAGPSRTPSGSPLPTPSSSQTRVADAAQKPRSRKPSLTTPDGVELDITDPWGTTWHHPSPYDFGTSPTSTVGTAAGEAHVPSRPRHASMTGYQIKRKAVPSPLSQSTSAVHLQPPTGSNVLRKLSKRKTATIGMIFGGRSDETKHNTASSPATPMDNPDTTQLYITEQVGHPEPGAASCSASLTTKTSKREKRGSILGRLAKKFSLLKKSNNSEAEGAADWQYVAPEDERLTQSIQHPITVAVPSIGDVDRNSPPPLNEPEPAPGVSKDADRSSSISVEVPYVSGRLTVVNPDFPSPESTPAGFEAPLPLDRLYQPTEPGPLSNSAEAMPEYPTSVSPRPPSSTTLPNPLHGDQSLQQDIEPVFAPPFYLPPQIFSDDAEVQESLPPTPPAKSRAPSPTLPPPTMPTETIPQDNVQSPVSSPYDSSIFTARQMNGHSSIPPDILPSLSIIHSQLHSNSNVPFPLEDDSIFVPPRPRYSYADSSTCSPLSTSSLAVNPPTPYNNETSIPLSPESPPPLVPEKEPTVTHSPGQTSNKRTETFKLVRGTTDRIQGSTDTIVAAGQQWEVVETLDSTRNKARSSSRKGRESRDRPPEGSHEKGKEKGRHADREWEGQRVRGVIPTEAKMKELPKEKERRRDASHDENNDRPRDRSHDEREKENRRRGAEKDSKSSEKESKRDRRDGEREREKERQREREREEAERERERVREQKERERQRQKELEREREKERQREKERERERQRQREREREREREKEREREREKERQREKERERQREREEKDRQREKARQKEKEKEERERREREQRHEKEREKERRREKEHRMEKKEKEKDKDRRDQERRQRHSEEQQRHHHRHDARTGSTSMISPEPGSAEAPHSHHRTGEREVNKVGWPEHNEGDRSSLLTTVQPTHPHLERNPSSASNRPTSAMLSAADMVAFGAKEAFEMERLFKARSLYGREPDGSVANSISSNLSDKGSSAGAIYGSGHTAYVFQTPFQGAHHSPNVLQDQIPDRSFSYFGDLEIRTIPSLDSPPNRPFSNPLPEPPRPASYQPTPLAVLESGATSDYWTKYTITTAH